MEPVCVGSSGWTAAVMSTMKKSNLGREAFSRVSGSSISRREAKPRATLAGRELEGQTLEHHYLLAPRLMLSNLSLYSPDPPA